ncbi:protein NETWORKED 4A-like isoform X2 [Andrographis paniculata]|nr:protein NETWORKED 4A-like isoform X2 [Andrographis paniculata]XP_051131163.1 protein NETWORKED 4A-like isoform X2 [Andrographis paniculata]
MASGNVKPSRMKMELKKSHLSWWDSHISSKSSKWLQENLEDMDQNVKKMVKLIEEDADSFAKKAELYFKKRPELLSLVEEFHRMYRALAERYGHVTGELRKNIPSDLQSQGSGISDAGSEPPWTTPSSRSKSGPRAAGFEFFLGSGGSGSDLNSKEGDDTSTTLDSDSESDDSSVNNYSSTRSNGGDENGLRGRVIELEGELRDVKEKFRRQQNEISEGLKKSSSENTEVDSKIAAYESELCTAREKIQRSEEEIVQLTIELQKYKSVGDSINISSEGAVEENHSNSFGLEPDQIADLKKEVMNLRQELTSKANLVHNLQEQLKSAQKEVSVWKNKIDREKRDAAKLQDRIARYKSNLADRDQEIRGLREAMSNANKSLSEENGRLQAEMTRMAKERAYLEDHIKELDLRSQSLEEEARRTRAAKDEMEAALGGRIERLMADVFERDEMIDELNQRVEELIAVKDGLESKIAVLGAEMNSKDERIAEMSDEVEGARKSGDELRSRVGELETEVERKQELILEAAEGKREAIRQLSFCAEYYRGEYHQLRLALFAHKPPMAATAR